MLSVLEVHGFKLYISLDQSNGVSPAPGLYRQMANERNVRQVGERSSETDTWYCCRPQGWVPGMQVYRDYSHAA